MATVTFENGQSVDFESTPTPQDIEEVAKKLNIQPLKSTSRPSQIKTLTGTDNPVGSLPVIKQANQLGAGIASSIGKQVLNIPKSVLKASQGVANVIGSDANYIPAINAIDRLSNNLYQKPIENELDSNLGKVGKVIGDVAPYTVGGVGGGTSKIANVATEGLPVVKKIPIVGKLLEKALVNPVGRIATGATAEGLANFGAGYALSGGDEKQAKNQALFAGGLKGASGALGETAKALKVPESLMGNIFKTDKKEMKDIFSGTKDGTFAKEVLDRGFSGTTKKLARQFTKGMQNSEQKISSEFAKAGNPSITLEEPQRFIGYLQTKVNMLKKSGAIKEARGLESTIPAIDPKTGEISANNALALRRFLDGLKYEKSFVAPTEELSAQQAGLKEMSDEIRHKINAIGGTGDAMKDYQFYIKGLDKLASHAVRTKNNDALGIINSFLLGESIANTSPGLAFAGLGRRFLNKAGGSTASAQFLENLPKSSATGSAFRSSISSLLPRKKEY